MGLFDRFRKSEESIIPINSQVCVQKDMDLVAMSNVMLMKTRQELETKNVVSMPIGELATLGGAVASLIPSLRTVTQTTTVGTSGLYKLANATVGDTLKIAKDGNFWGAFKTAEGSSKFAKLAEVGQQTATSSIVMPIDPATMMMAVALYSIEQQLGEIVEMEKKILSFLEQEKEAEVEADLKTLTKIIQEYKYNWDKQQFTSNNHKLSMDIMRTAEKNMIFYQKQMAEVIKGKQLLVAGATVDSAQKSLEKKFKYYRLSLYIYALASYISMMLLGNFQEGYIKQSKSEIEKHAYEYEKAYKDAYGHIEKMGSSVIEAHVVKGLGVAGEAVGNLIGSIPKIKDGQVDEWLVEKGTHLKETSKSMKHKAADRFEHISDSGIDSFLSRFDEMNQICNHAESICFDNEKIYLIAG